MINADNIRRPSALAIYNRLVSEGLHPEEAASKARSVWLSGVGVAERQSARDYSRYVGGLSHDHPH